MSNTAILRGIAWNHSRALPPLVATAQRFEELHPDAKILWEKRSLHDFGHADVVSLASRYDLLVIDHPMMGIARESHALLELQKFFPRLFLDDLSSDSVGQSYESYCCQDSVLALPIDAAAPAASYRPDLLDRAGYDTPRTWDGVIELARKGLVVAPGFHVDVFMNFMGMYVSVGGRISEDSEECFERETARQCLDLLRDLGAHLPEEVYQWNPISVYERMAASDRHAYCPFAYTYSNYSRAAFAKRLILFTNPVSLGNGQPLRTVLGGTGIAISSHCAAIETAVDYIKEVAGADWQRTLYGLSGGQPARRSAWRDETLNQIAHGFFKQTLDSMEHAYLRPRYAGYIEFQEQAGVPMVNYLRGGGSTASVVEDINALYRQSRRADVTGRFK
ncbi:MAG: extracellular solute-binding protein [Terriglobia bacterium]